MSRIPFSAVCLSGVFDGWLCLGRLFVVCVDFVVVLLVVVVTCIGSVFTLSHVSDGM